MGRFLAIAVIAALGTGFYAGLQMTAPDMKLAGDMYYDGGNFSDIRVLSTLGISDETVEALRGIEGVEGVMPAYEADVLATLEGTQYVVRIHSLDVKDAKSSDTSDGVNAVSSNLDYINRPILVEGSWPSSPRECVISADAVLDSAVSIGDTLKVLEGTQDIDATFEETEYTVVGLVRSCYYASSTSLGSTSLGSGSLDTYVYVPTEAFCADAPYTEAFVTVAGAKDLASSSEAYQNLVEQVKQRIEDAAPSMSAARLDEVKAQAQSELDDARAEFEQQRADALAQLADGQLELDSAKAELDAARAALDAALSEITVSEQRLVDGTVECEQGELLLAQQQSQAADAFAAAEAKLIESQQAYDQALAQRAELEESLKQVEAGIAAIDESVPDIEGSLAAAYAALDAIDAQIVALNPSSPFYESIKAVLDAKRAEAVEGIAALEDAASQRASLVEAKAQIEEGLALIDEQTAGVQEALDAGWAELAAQKASAESGFAQGRATLDEAWSQVESGLAQLEQGKSEYARGVAEYENGLSSYESGVAEFDEKSLDAQRQLADAQAQIDDAQAAIDQLEPGELYAMDREKNPGSVSFESDADRIGQIAQVFPFIFFLVAALVSLTTMTRMVEEERVLIGTFKALGYGNGRITSKYLLYAAIASGVGSAVGIAVFSLFLPWFIMQAYSIVYAVPPRPTPLDPGITLLSAGLGIGITVGATWFAAGSTLRERPASLMLPRAPKAGKRILLERIRPLWIRFSFSWKVTARNLFRYKRRFFMAIVGIAGCTALLLTGLGLQNAINDIIDKQFGEIYKYNMVVRMADDASDDDVAAVERQLGDAAHAQRFSFMHTDTMIARSDDVDADQRLELVVPQSAEQLNDYVTVRERVGHKPLSLSDEGVVISEKLANELGLSVGDTLILYGQDSIGNATGEGYRVAVAGIMENYVSQYAFMAPSLYEEVMGQAPQYRTVYAQAVDDESVRAGMSDALLALDGVKTVGYNDETIDSYRTMLKSVDSVVVILVIAAALLAFVVLYNLTNINITERQREIATLKVLGFTPHEVNAYIYRETFLLSVLGALAGCVLGIYMEGFVVVTAEVSQVMFGREIHPESFLIAFVLTMVFTVIVTVAMRRKLDKIDMVESLKSIE